MFRFTEFRRQEMDIKTLEQLTPFSEMELIGIDDAEDVY